MKYCCNKCNENGIYTEVKKEGRFVSEDGRVLCERCSVGETLADKNFLGKLEIDSKIREELGFSILNNAEKVQKLKIDSDAHELNYYFTFEGEKYMVTYLKYLMEVEISIINENRKQRADKVCTFTSLNRKQTLNRMKESI